MTDDPFSDEADPYAGAPRVTRRELAKLVVTATAASGALTACVAPRRLACQTLAEDKERCQAKFCRYFKRR